MVKDRQLFLACVSGLGPPPAAYVLKMVPDGAGSMRLETYPERQLRWIMDCYLIMEPQIAKTTDDK
jgi:hypothetical protein